MFAGDTEGEVETDTGEVVRAIRCLTIDADFDLDLMRVLKTAHLSPTCEYESIPSLKNYMVRPGCFRYRQIIKLPNVYISKFVNNAKLQGH